jgi:hypothetical protein
MWELVNVKEIMSKTHCPVATKKNCLAYIITMACIRNMHSLIGSRNFALPMHKQQFMFYSAKDKKMG